MKAGGASCRPFLFWRARFGESALSNDPDKSWLKLAVATALSGIQVNAAREALGDASNIVAASPQALKAAGLTDRQRTVMAAVPDALLDEISDWQAFEAERS